MPPDHSGALQPMTPAFRRRVNRTVLVLAGFATAVFGVAIDHFLQTRLRCLNLDRARFCAAALTPGPGGDLSASVARLRTRYQGLIAVGVLDPSNHLKAVFPDEIPHRRAALAALAADERPVRVDDPQDRQARFACGVVVPVIGGSSTPARKALIVLRSDDERGGWVRATAACGLIVTLASLVWARLLYRWFNLRVGVPLGDLARAAQRPWSAKEPAPTIDAGGWLETRAIADGLKGLFRSLAESDARAQRLQHETEHRLQNRQVGFDRQLRRVRDQIATDALTKLRNRSFLEERLEPLMQRQLAAHADLSAIMIDVDDFKQYNDRCGHQVGDAVLRFMGKMLRSAIRPTDHAVRYGGDEFLLLLPDTSAEQAGVVAERLVKLFAQYASELEEGGNLSLSAGVASLDRDRPKSGHDLVAKADAALYAAKRTGKNMVTRFVAA